VLSEPRTEVQVLLQEATTTEAPVQTVEERRGVLEWVRHSVKHSQRDPQPPNREEDLPL